MARHTRRASGEQSLAEMLRGGLQRDVEELRGGDPAGGDAEAVHDALVALRRLRSALRSYRPVLDARWAGEVGAELGWLANQLDPVRALDVRRRRVESGLRLLAAGSSPSRSSLPAEDGPAEDGPAEDGAAEDGAAEDGAAEDGAAALLGRLELERGSALAAFVASRQSPRHDLVLRFLDELSSSPPVTRRADGTARELVPRLLERPWRDLRAAAKSARSSPGASELHAVRSRARQLRYSAELASPLFGEALRRVARACATLQGTLSDHHDALEAAGWLTSAAHVPEAAFLAGRLFAAEERLATVALASVDADWRDVRRRWRRWQATTLG